MMKILTGKVFAQAKGGRMNIFVILCNPKQHSLKDEYVKTYIDESKNKGHDVRVVNIYDLDIDYLRANGDDFDYSITEELKQAQENMKWANQLVFVYPVWCLTIPAIMKSFMDRVFAEGVAAEMTARGPKPLMKDKTAVIMHSYSMPYFYFKYFYGDLLMKWWKIVLTDWCGPKIIKRFDFDLIDSVSEKRKQKWIKDIKNFVSKM